MLMHFQFCFESIPNELTPAAMLRYYRQRKGLTTRQLAESEGIVPATLLMYEREKFPIPYPTALAFADILEIDRNLLFDDFARFIDYPYSNRLREVRKAYGLNQADFGSFLVRIWIFLIRFENLTILSMFQEKMQLHLHHYF